MADETPPAIRSEARIELTLTLPDGRVATTHLPVEGLTSPPWWADRALARKAAKWLAVAVVGALISSYVADRLALHQRELEVQGQFITDISRGSVQAFLDAQTAHRATDPAERERVIEQVADTWVLASSTITPQVRLYYGAGSEVSNHWDSYQAAVYAWIELGGVDRPDTQVERAESLRTYLAEHVGEPTRTAPVDDPWAALGADPDVAGDVYQWAGYSLLRGRGALLEDLKAGDADVG